MREGMTEREIFMHGEIKWAVHKVKLHDHSSEKLKVQCYSFLIHPGEYKPDDRDLAVPFDKRPAGATMSDNERSGKKGVFCFIYSEYYGARWLDFPDEFHNDINIG